MSKGLGCEFKHYIDNEPDADPRDDSTFVSDDPDKPPVFCTYTQQMVGKHLGLLTEAGVWPVDRRGGRLGSIIEALNDYELPRFSWDINCDQHSDDNWFRDNYPSLITELQALAKGCSEAALCLDCFKKANGQHAGTCRVQHDGDIVMASPFDHALKYHIGDVNRDFHGRI